MKALLLATLPGLTSVRNVVLVFNVVHYCETKNDDDGDDDDKV